MALAIPTTTSDYSVADNAAASSITANKPANVANGDLFVAFLYYRNSGSTITPPTGWSLADSNTTGQTEAVYYKAIPTASAETATSYTWSFTGGSGRIAVILFRVTGANLSSPLDASGLWESGPTSTMVFPAVTAVSTNTMLLAFGLAQNATTTASVFTAPSGMTTLVQQGFISGTNSSAVWTGFQSISASGSTGTRTATLSPNAANGNGIMITIAPAGATPPTASFTNAEVGLDVNVDGTGSTASSPATITGYDWNWGDSTTHGSGSTATHTYAAAGTYTVTLTVTDSNSNTGNTSTSVTVTAPGTQAQPTSVTSSTGFTSNSGTVLNAITDLSSGQPVLTTFVSGGDGSVLVGAVGPVAPPANGNPLVAVVSCDRQLASTGTITGKLYEKDGVTLRSTATASIPDMTASGGSGTTLGNQSYVSIVWPWTDVQNVADWNQLVFSFTFNAS